MFNIATWLCVVFKRNTFLLAGELSAVPLSRLEKLWGIDKAVWLQVCPGLLPYCPSLVFIVVV